MVADLFESLLEEFGTLLKVKLVVGAGRCCAIKSKSGVIIQLEIDRTGQDMLMICKLPECPPSGRYRENLFYEALRADGLPPPQHGVIAYSKKTNQLVIFKRMILQDLTGAKIYNAFTPLLAKAQIWHDAISRGEVPQPVSTNTTKSPAGLFGLR
jgi:hypothetical protein